MAWLNTHKLKITRETVGERIHSLYWKIIGDAGKSTMEHDLTSVKDIQDTYYEIEAQLDKMADAKGLDKILDKIKKDKRSNNNPERERERERASSTRTTTITCRHQQFSQ